jgi:hypothetical protein
MTRSIGKPFVKGDSRINRKGRPKVGQSLAEKFRDALNESLTGDYTNLDSIIDKVVTKAMKGNQDAIEYVLARSHGKVIERIETTNVNQNYDFTNLSMDERLKLLEQLKSARSTIVPSNNPDTN